MVGIVAIGEHLRLMESLEIEEVDGGFTIYNPNTVEVRGASFRLSTLTEEPSVFIDGVGLGADNYRWKTDGYSFFFDLKPTTKHRIELVSPDRGVLHPWKLKLVVEDKND